MNSNQRAKTPLVSIIIPFFNRAEFLEATLDSIQEQSFIDWECILVDDHSTDESANIALKYASRDARFKCVIRPSDRIKGANACRNFGYEQSHGKYIQWFDSDDIMPKDALAQKVLLIENQSVDFVVGKVIFFEKTNEHIHRPYLLRSQNMLSDYISNNLFFYTHGPLFNRLFLDNQPYLFDENLQMRQDGEFYFRLLLTQPKYIASELITAYIRVHPKNMTGNHKNKHPLDRIRIDIGYYFRCVENYLKYPSLQDKRFEWTSIQLIRSHANHSKSFQLLNDVYKCFNQVGLKGNTQCYFITIIEML